MNESSNDRANIREFLTSRRSRITPGQVGLPEGSRRRVPGLRREEVAVLAGVSPEWYTRLEKGNIAGVSVEVLQAVATALQLSEEERTYLLELAQSARGTYRRSTRKKSQEQPAEHRQWLLDSMTGSAALIRNGRLDMLASNHLSRALLRPMFDSDTSKAHGYVNFARFHFLDPAAKEFFADWEGGAHATAALLRVEASREPHDAALRELIGELSTVSREFGELWAKHDIRFIHEGLKNLNHPEVGPLELYYQTLSTPTQRGSEMQLTTYTARPGSADADKLALLSSLAGNHIQA
ncbi:helix-turn-helix transcriptional regulator [Glutamicibacter sp. NPDC087344]|uniref:helix-turn-helix transcriptional regulator n=1 Tax=Glutamicibacter sp. NPDC087344 TaxID=3363994 RepID=UPI00380B236D